MVFGGYSALQGYSAILVHSEPVMFDIRHALNNFSCGNSPLVRALQFLAACLFQRGDVRKSPHLTVLAIPQKYLEYNCNAAKAVSSQQNKVGLMTGFSLFFPRAKCPDGVNSKIKADLTLLPAGASEVKLSDWFTDVIENKDKTFSLDTVIAEMKRKGIFPPDNQSVPSKEIYQSDTGEILLKAHEKIMKIITPRTEAICIEKGKTAKLKIMEINLLTTSGCIALCAVDNKKLESSRRMVLLYVTEEANSNMELCSNRETMEYIGTAPVLAKTGKVKLTLKRPEKMTLYALGIDGSRREKIPVNYIDEKQIITINTADLKDGPTPFFELLIE